MESEIKAIIANYKAEIEEAASEYQRKSAMEYAFGRILEVVEAEDGK